MARFEKDPKKPEDSLGVIEERANAAVEVRELANRRLEHYELGSGLAQIAIVLASAAIITGIGALVWLSVALGALGAVFFSVERCCALLAPASDNASSNARIAMTRATARSFSLASTADSAASGISPILLSFTG